MTTLNPPSLSDAELLLTVRTAAHHERESTVRVVALIAEVDHRRLYLGEGYSSIFGFCTQALKMSEQAAYARIEAGRLARRFPAVLDRLADGRLSLTNLGLLAPQLTDENADALFEAVARKSKREVERMIAALHPQPDIPASIRALPSRSALPTTSSSLDLAPLADTTASLLAVDAPPLPSKSPVVSAAPAVIAPLAPRRYLLRVTIGEDTQNKLDRARALLRHEVPDGDPAVLIDRALSLLVAHAERSKFAATKRPRGTGSRPASDRSRRIPAAVRREVWARDQGRCAFQGSDRRCNEAGFLEFHHVVPFAAGGASTAENLELRCRAHNGHEAERAGLKLWRPDSARSGPS